MTWSILSYLDDARACEVEAHLAIYNDDEAYFKQIFAAGGRRWGPHLTTKEQIPRTRGLLNQTSMPLSSTMPAITWYLSSTAPTRSSRAFYTALVAANVPVQRRLMTPGGALACGRSGGTAKGGS